MKAAVLRAAGIDNLHVDEIAEPGAPGPGEVLVRLRMASLNYRDLVMIEGGYGSLQRIADVVVLSDGAGEVAAVGEGVTRFEPGARVIGTMFQDWLAGPLTDRAAHTTLGGLTDGVASQYRLFPEHGLVATPDHLDDAQASTLPVAALTAWNAVVEQGRIGPGDIVVTQGTGGVSVFALQFAKLAGAEVIATSSSDVKLERIRALGADHLINYAETAQWARPVRELTGGRGADHIVDVGGGGTLDQSIRAVRTGGTISLIGVLDGASSELALGRVVTRNVRLQGVTCGSRAHFEAMNRAIVRHRLEPVVDRTFALADIHAALDYLRAGRHFCKICVEI